MRYALREITITNGTTQRAVAVVLVIPKFTLHDNLKKLELVHLYVGEGGRKHTGHYRAQQAHTRYWPYVAGQRMLSEGISVSIS